MSKNNINILNRIFTRNTFRHWIDLTSDKTYKSVVKRYVVNPDNKNNEQLISEIYCELKNNYRNEYYYKNTLLNKLLLGVHSINSTTALTEIAIAKSKADFVMINGKAVVYEIKTELDNLDRLDSQINDYYKAFNRVVVVTCEENLLALQRKLDCIDKPIGIYILQKNGRFKIERKPEDYNDCIDAEVLFKIMRKPEFEEVILKKIGKLPNVSQFKYYTECKKMFYTLPIEEAYSCFLKQLKKRNVIIKDEFYKVPYELKFLAYFLEPVKNLINLQPQMQTAVVAADRLGEILDLEPERVANENKKLSLNTLRGDIWFKGITFRYGTRRPVLENITMHIKQGEKIALVGESGSGKTTLVKLLLHLYSPEEGEILINSNNIKDVNIESLRDKIAYIPQETFLFSGSIMDNLTLGLDDVTPEEVIEASKKAQAHDFINDLPLRYETRLEENGSNLSGGQRQRLAIARAILKKPDILILDEATSNLDSITERAIEKTINEYSKGMTTIIIAHRLSTIMRCNNIYIMEKGRIIESGNHDQLLKCQGNYAKLWDQQKV